MKPLLVDGRGIRPQVPRAEIVRMTTFKYYVAYTSIRGKSMVLRCLTTEEIDTLTAKKGVRAIAVHNLCSSMGGQTSMQVSRGASTFCTNLYISRLCSYN